MQLFCIMGVHIPLSLSIGVDPWLNDICFQLLYSLPGVLYTSWIRTRWLAQRILTRNNKGMKSQSTVTRQQKLLPSPLQIQTKAQGKRKHECFCGNSGHENFNLSKPANCISELFRVKIFDEVFIKPLISREAESCKPPVTVVSSAIVQTAEKKSGYYFSQS